jgi:3-phytase
MKLFSLFALILLFSSCASSPKNISSDKIKIFTMANAPSIGKTMSDQEIKLGGLSGLQFIEEKNGDLYFYAITDRGPTSSSSNNDRTFLLQDFAPTIVTLKADSKTGTLEVVKSLPLKKRDGKPLSGFPNVRDEENSLDVFGFMNSIDELGMDTESLAINPEGGWWVGEEYAPSLVFFDQLGKLQRRLTPDNELPRLYKSRRPNRGFEAIALNGNKLYGFLQSPLKKEETSSLIVEVDLLDSKTSAEYFYQFEKGNDKIGDAEHVKDNKFLVIEQNGNDQKELYLIELGLTDQPVKKTLVLDLATTPFNGAEKIEGLALIGLNRVALVYDNDFQINGNTDFKTGLTPLNQTPNQLMIIDLNLEDFLK